MYSSLKKISAITIILAIITAVASVLTIMMVAPIEAVPYTMLIAIAAAMGGTSLSLIIIGAALWNLHGDLEAHMDATYADITALKKRVEDLENKQK